MAKMGKKTNENLKVWNKMVLIILGCLTFTTIPVMTAVKPLGYVLDFASYYILSVSIFQVSIRNDTRVTPESDLKYLTKLLLVVGIQGLEVLLLLLEMQIGGLYL